jgi:primosomal protein N' (replication factor Y)
VRFAGKLTSGFLLERVQASEHAGQLAKLERVVGSDPVLTPEIAALARAAADRWAGTLSDVLRLAVPPRHAEVERQASTVAAPVIAPEQASVAGYDDGPALLDCIARGDAVRAVWSMLPGAWPAQLAAAAAAAVSAGHGVVVVVPDGRDVVRVGTALADAIGRDSVVELVAGLGPRERYRRFLRLLRGAAPVAVGTRAAVWAPVADLGLIIVWDDGDDLLAEPRAPYPHAREVAALRSHLSGTGLIIAGHAVTAEGQSLVEAGWAVAVDPRPEVRRAAWARVRAAGDDAERDADGAARSARLPTLAWRTARDALRHGPVLVQVPRRGYAPRLACAKCRAPAGCDVCKGPLIDQGSGVTCAWCGTRPLRWECSTCAGRTLRATVVGARRTAEELGRAFPGVPVRTSGGETVLATVGGEPALVVATPGAEPVAAGGYAAALLLDGWVLLSRPDLRVGEETLRRWLAATALIRPVGDGGAVVVMAPAELPVVRALTGARPRGYALRELADRRELHLPPAARLATLTGRSDAIADALALVDLPVGAELLGPVEVPPAATGEPLERVLIKVPISSGRSLAEALKAAAGIRSARKAEHPVRIMVDPIAIG